LSRWLARFDVGAQSILIEPPIRKGTGQGSQRLRLVLTTKIDSQLNLYGRIGYEYNRKRSGYAALAVQYLKHKRRHLDGRKAAHCRVRELAAAVASRPGVLDEPLAADVNLRFVERSLYSAKEYLPRVS